MNKSLETGLVAKHKCGGYDYNTPTGIEHDCTYGVEFPCEDCIFVCGALSNDFRKGKKPCAKKYQGEVINNG